ncbi:MFS transporter [Streptomyces castrisilvae]|uniref:MFS transporter n=1 Tax=Streptomyces castrisilvae TaxID=3033811 RepID=A0ABY9HKJ2_9ACTN|nr:MFS transporter [Streptomyces sp. Mut1]WLQ35070.1 MFS transporter [Streptomyces sp. Mut1]
MALTDTGDDRSAPPGRAREAAPGQPGSAGAGGPSRRVRFGYASGSLVSGTFTTLPGLLLLPYLTDTLGVGAALAGAVVFLPKAWDVVLNPFVGRASDRTRTRWGSRRPYVLLGGLVMALGFALTFAGPLPGSAGAWFTGAGYLLTATAFAFFQVPYVAMPAELADREEDRMRLVAGRVAVIGIAALVTGAAAPALVDAGGGGLTGHRWAGAFGAAVVALGALWTFAGTRSTRGATHTTRGATAGRTARGATGTPATATAGTATGTPRVPAAEPTLREQFAAARANPPFVALLRCVVLQSVATGVLLAGAPYFADHVLRDSSGVGALVAAFVAPNLLTMPLWSRLRGPRGYALASALFIAGCLLFLASPFLPEGAVLVTMALAGTGHAGQLLFLYAMLPDCVARDTTRTGRRQGGVLSGVFTTAEGLGVAIGPFLYGLVLQLCGYVSSGTGDAAEQSLTARVGILAGFGALPALAAVAAVLLLRSYNRPY